VRAAALIPAASAGIAPAHGSTCSAPWLQQLSRQSPALALMSRTCGSILGWFLGKTVVFKDVTSPSGTGQMSCLSDPIETVDPLQFWFALLRVLKYPELSSFVIDSDLLEASATAAVVRQKYNGQVMDFLGKGHGDGSEVSLIFRHRIYKDRRYVVSVISEEWSGKVRSRNYVQLHQNPLIVEGWHVTAGDPLEQQDASARMRRVLDVILRRTGIDADIQLNLEYDDKEEPRIVTDPLDEHMAFERLWDEWVDVVKYHTSQDRTVKSTDVVPQLADEFLITHTFSREDADPNSKKEDSRSIVRVILDEEARRIHIEEWEDSLDYARDVIPLRLWYTFSPQDKPLTVTLTTELPGERKADWLTQALIQNIVDCIIKDPVNPTKKTS